VALAGSAFTGVESEADEDEGDWSPEAMDQIRGEYHPNGIDLDALEPEPLPDETLYPPTDTGVSLPTPEDLQNLRKDRFDPDELEYGEWEVVSPEGMKEENEYYYSGLFEDEYSSDEEGFDEDLKVDPALQLLQAQGLYVESLFANAKLEKNLRQIEAEAMEPDWDAEGGEQGGAELQSYSTEAWGDSFGSLMGPEANSYDYDDFDYGLDGEESEDEMDVEEDDEEDESEAAAARREKEERIWMGGVAEEVYTGLREARKQERAEGILNPFLDLSEDEFEELFKEELPPDSMAKVEHWRENQVEEQDHQEVFTYGACWILPRIFDRLQRAGRAVLCCPQNAAAQVHASTQHDWHMHRSFQLTLAYHLKQVVFASKRLMYSMAHPSTGEQVVTDVRGMCSEYPEPSPAVPLVTEDELFEFDYQERIKHDARKVEVRPQPGAYFPCTIGIVMTGSTTFAGFGGMQAVLYEPVHPVLL
jgi:hypothetical protein